MGRDEVGDIFATHTVVRRCEGDGQKNVLGGLRNAQPLLLYRLRQPR